MCNRPSRFQRVRNRRSEMLLTARPRGTFRALRTADRLTLIQRFGSTANLNIRPPSSPVVAHAGGPPPRGGEVIWSGSLLAGQWPSCLNATPEVGIGAKLRFRWPGGR